MFPKLQQLFTRWRMAGALALGLITATSWSNPIQVEHIRDGKVIATYHTKNGIVTEGLNSLLDVGFRNQTQNATWYMGLVNNSGFSAFANADTMSSHAGWTEFTSYDEANRPTWTPSAAASRAITNGTPVEFTISASGTVRGIFIVTNNTISGTTGVLWATAQFASNVAVVDNDVLKVTYTISG